MSEFLDPFSPEYRDELRMLMEMRTTDFSGDRYSIHRLIQLFEATNSIWRTSHPKTLRNHAAEYVTIKLARELDHRLGID